MAVVAHSAILQDVCLVFLRVMKREHIYFGWWLRCRCVRASDLHRLVPGRLQTRHKRGHGGPDDIGVEQQPVLWVEVQLDDDIAILVAEGRWTVSLGVDEVGSRLAVHGGDSEAGVLEAEETNCGRGCRGHLGPGDDAAYMPMSSGRRSIVNIWRAQLSTYYCVRRKLC
jgi:hypothetical protein